MAEIIISSVLCVCFAVMVGLAVVMAAHSLKDDKEAEKRREAQEFVILNITMNA